jgi:hypothetical protein
MNVEQIARVCHAANREFCRTLGDFSQQVWEEADEWHRHSTINSVEFVLSNPDAPASALHGAWLRERESKGCIHGGVKDPAKKEHPGMVPYAELSIEERLKDHLFRAIVNAFRGAISEG